MPFPIQLKLISEHFFAVIWVAGKIADAQAGEVHSCTSQCCESCAVHVNLVCFFFFINNLV